MKKFALKKGNWMSMVLAVIGVVAFGGGTNCFVFFYQPDQPEALKGMKMADIIRISQQ